VCEVEGDIDFPPGCISSSSEKKFLPQQHTTPEKYGTEKTKWGQGMWETDGSGTDRIEASGLESGIVVQNE